MDFKEEYEDFLASYRFTLEEMLDRINKGNAGRPDYSRLKLDVLNSKLTVLKELAALEKGVSKKKSIDKETAVQI